MTGNQRLDEMKKEYQNIPVPEELRARVEQAITEAKSEKSAPPKKGLRFFVPRAAGMAAAAMLVITILANSGPSVAYAMERVPILGAVVRVVTFRDYQRQDENMTADIAVPEVAVEDGKGNVLQEPTDRINKSIQDYTDEIIAAYEADVKENEGQAMKTVDLAYQVVSDTDRLFSIRFDRTVVMASGAESVKIYHVDKMTGEMIQLKDLFANGADYIGVISDNIKEQMRERMAADENACYWVDSDMPEMDFTEISEGTAFYVNDKGHLVIVFDEYSAAPGYMGMPEFEIPTEILSGMLKDGYLQP